MIIEPPDYGTWNSGQSPEPAFPETKPDYEPISLNATGEVTRPFGSAGIIQIVSKPDVLGMSRSLHSNGR